jgi:phosphoserine phosphatase RsbU/P
MTREISIIEKLEKDLSLKQLQIRSLLTITQAINDNVSQDGLFDMYRSFLSWEMGIEKMALLVNDAGNWYCACHINCDDTNTVGLIPHILQHKRLHTIKAEDSKEIQDFNIIIPVLHKDYSIAYSIIGGLKEKEDLYNKIQFITTITNIISVAIENKRLFKRQLEQQKLEKELELAKEVQGLLIPENFANYKGMELAKIYRPHLNIGGDYIDFIHYDENRFALCIADISGKGVAAALLMANFQAVIQSLIFQYRDLETFVYALNQVVFRITKGDRFITFFVCEFDLKKKTLRYVNAGHFPPIIINKQKEIRRLKAGCTVIGAFEKLPEIKEEQINLIGDELLMCYTDGLGELVNEYGEYFEESSLEQFIKDNNEVSAKDFAQNLEDKIDDFAKNEGLKDDIAVLLCKLV